MIGLQKQIELIIRRCLNIIDRRMIREVHTDWEHGYNAALKKVRGDILRIFGME
jgi:hypothetical protein